MRLVETIALSMIAFLAGCPKPAQPAVEEIEEYLDSEKLIDAGRDKVASGDPEAPLLLKGIWRLMPGGFHVWTLCQGDQDAQGCVLFVGRIGSSVTILDHVPIGWAPPKVRLLNGRVVVEGEDGRSSFLRSLELEEGQPVIGDVRRPEGA